MEMRFSYVWLYRCIYAFIFSLVNKIFYFFSLSYLEKTIMLLNGFIKVIFILNVMRCLKLYI